ncbi:MAG TPA: hypothetical protein VEX66_03040 [Microlunatus sp.]|nr:hypothetical protein [Microlunatus sp.]
MPRRFRSGLIGLIAVLFLLVSGCGSDEPSGSDKPAPDKSSATADASAKAEPTKKPKPSGTTIDITFKGDTVDPNGVEKKVKAGKPITLHIVADKPGELHVHSSPEQEIEYDAGTSNKKLTIDRPGIVEVESHTLEQLVVVLEVR